MMLTSRSRRFPPTPSSVRAARFYTAAALRETHAPRADQRYRADCVGTATNAVQHAATIFEVAIHTDGVVRINVRDQSRSRPNHDPRHRQHPLGRGLHLLDALSDRWGVEMHDDYKSAWCEKDLR